jgi:Fe-S-cluster containining protein
MSAFEADDEPRRPAGGFSSWLGGMQDALRGEGSASVTCDGCTACCTSSQFVHIGPDELDTLDHVPSELLFPAPRMPAGHVLLGYDEHGNCPMLGDDGCSIYEHRPRTCRTYDCRVFPAAGVELDDRDKQSIADRAARWEFAFPTPVDHDELAAVRAAATFLAAHAESLADAAPITPTHRAVLAIEIHRLFLRGDPGVDAVRAEVLRRARPAGSPP